MELAVPICVELRDQLLSHQVSLLGSKDVQALAQAKDGAQLSFGEGATAVRVKGFKGTPNLPVLFC